MSPSSSFTKTLRLALFAPIVVDHTILIVNDSSVSAIERGTDAISTESNNVGLRVGDSILVEEGSGCAVVTRDIMSSGAALLFVEVVMYGDVSSGT